MTDRALIVAVIRHARRDHENFMDMITVRPVASHARRYRLILNLYTIVYCDTVKYCILLSFDIVSLNIRKLNFIIFIIFYLYYLLLHNMDKYRYVYII